jgi:hypothetical protein
MQRTHLREWGVTFVLAMLAGCSADAAAPARQEEGEPRREPGADAGAPAQPPDDRCGAGEFDSTFAAIQGVIFEQRGCTNGMCHGAAAMGDLDLRADAAYRNLVEVKSANSPLFRVMPGEPDESFLFNKLRAGTEPGSVEIGGSPMPSGAAPLRAEQLEAVRRWIEAGAPQDGSVGDSSTGRSDVIAELLGSCLPDATPVSIGALEPPPASQGVQLAMAPFSLPAQAEIELCFAQYYDFSDVVPAEFQDAERGVFFVNGQRLRQDPHSHHLVISHSGLGAEAVNDPSFGAWTCRGGDVAGEPCDPLQRSACGAGLCASESKPSTACIGFGPPGGDSILGSNQIGGAQTAQFHQPPREGLFEVVPIRGIVYMNSHAFNLTQGETQLHAWLNLLYARERIHELEDVTTGTNKVAQGQAPFTKKTYCEEWVAPQGSQLYTLTSHTHKRGSHFTVDLADGTRIYTNALYSDPIVQAFDPPLAFVSEAESERTLEYCAEFNNGVAEDGSPDLDLVTRLSRMPDRTTCEPVACVAGKIGGPCDGAEDNAACDSSPGAGDGWCDACPITGGVTTENEMFFLLPSIVRM